MRISFDMDGVLADFCSEVYAAGERLFGITVPVGYEQKTWLFSELYTRAQWDKIWNTLLNESHLWQNLPPLRENVEALRDFIKQNPNTEIFYITSRPKCAGSLHPFFQTQNWLNANGLGKTENIVVSSDKDFWVGNLSVEFSIDDLGSNVRACAAVPGHKAYLLNKGYNTADTDLTRVATVKEFLEVVRNARANRT